jgi:serine/threonine protein kinase
MGTPGYIDPFVIKTLINKNRLTKILPIKDIAKADLFSIGAILFFLITGNPLIRGDSNEELLVNSLQLHQNTENLIKTQLSGRVSEKCINFFKDLIKEHPAERLSAQEMLSHSWLVGLLPEIASVNPFYF